ncbi:hypothetical protein MBLNU13_g01475t2 [Cladosporium sp. NU13]
MNFSLIDGLAEGMANVSLQDGAPNAFVNRSQDSAIAHAPPSQATLLEIPQELRNKIFEYVYDVCDKPDSCIDVVFHDPALGSATDQDSDPRLSSTLRRVQKMQAAAIRHYWSKNIFSIESTGPKQLPHHAYQAVRPRDLMHAEPFILQLIGYGLEFPVAIRFEAGQWTASSDVSEDYLENILHKKFPDSP